MIVDCHTHVWASVEQLGRGAGLWSTPSGGDVPPKATPEEHQTASKPVDKTFVLAFRSHYLEAHVPNEWVANYVGRHPDRLVGFASVDPTRPAEAIDELRHAHDELGMQGLTIWPAAQDFHPASTSAMRLYPEAARLGVPVLFHTDVLALPNSKMEYARPMLVDEVAREFPELRIIVAQLGYPWTEETIVLLGKHANVFADISGLMRHPWHAYSAFLSAYQANVMDRLLFGSNFPYNWPAACIEALYSINQFCHGTNLPTIPREQLRQIVERDTLALLGIDSDASAAPPEPDTSVVKAEE
jgi:predicted TIM-barrel fold metal-dependent hydrolase